MKRIVLLGVASAVACASFIVSPTRTAEALIVCAKDDGTGEPREGSKLFLKTACTLGREVRVGTSDDLAGTCPADSVQVGEACVDKYESSVWATTDAATIQAIRDGAITSAGELLGVASQHGAALTDDYGAGCPDSGAGCTDYYAVSIPGVTPSRIITWFQAQAACRNAGKRLATNAEWQAAAYGTPDSGVDDGFYLCNISDGSSYGDVANAGSRSICVSDVGAFDMVGNLAEWVGDWEEGISSNCTDWTSQTAVAGGDLSCFGYDGSTTSYRIPAALFRGGRYDNGASAGVFAVDPAPPSFSFGLHGFRCAR